MLMLNAGAGTSGCRTTPSSMLPSPPTGSSNGRRLSSHPPSSGRTMGDAGPKAITVSSSSPSSCSSSPSPSPPSSSSSSPVAPNASTSSSFAPALPRYGARPTSRGVGVSRQKTTQETASSRRASASIGAPHACEPSATELSAPTPVPTMFPMLLDEHQRPMTTLRVPSPLNQSPITRTAAGHTSAWPKACSAQRRPKYSTGWTRAK